MHYDLIIIGGGLVGRSLACALSKAPLKIALIDASAKEQPDPRLIALNYGSICFLKSLGLWEKIEALSSPIHEVHVSNRSRFGITRLRREQAELPYLGAVVRAHDLNQALHETLFETEKPKNYTELRPVRVKALAMQENSTTLSLERSGEEFYIKGDLILAADGTHSTIRRLLNFETETFDYQQSALVTTTELSHPHNHCAYERFLEQGALAMLPLKNETGEDRVCATIWTADTASIESLQQLDKAAFVQTLQTQFGYRLGRLKDISQRYVFPLKGIQVKNPFRGNVLLIGNAAHTIHPLAAQGLNVALYEIAHLSQALLDNLRKGQALRLDLEELQKHFQPRLNLLFSHYLNQIFTSQFWGSKLARQLGMVGLDLCPPLKKHFGRRMAMESIQWLIS